MSENTVVITEKDGKYHINNNGISEFALLGILECIIFEMKSVKRQKLSSHQLLGKEVSTGNTQDRVEFTAPNSISPESTASKSNAPELRTRISNAVKAIKSLGGEVPDFNAGDATDEELQAELEALTEQYKRLKNSKAARK
jgi:hypothetical protein